MKKLSKSKRKQIIKHLLTTQGNYCIWCHKEMEIPESGEPAKNINNMVTVEHYFAKKLNDINNTKLLLLAHKKCNR